MQEQSFLSAFDRQPWRTFKNTTAEMVPAWGLLRVTGFEMVNGEIEFQVGQPNATAQAAYLVNGPIDADPSGRGLCTTLMQGGLLLVDLTSGTPAAGQTWGAKAGQWSAVKDAPGFFVGGAHQGSGAKARVAAFQIPQLSFGGVSYHCPFENAHVANGIKDITNYASQADVGNKFGWEINLASGVATYTGPDRWFLHFASGSFYYSNGASGEHQGIVIGDFNLFSGSVLENAEFSWDGVTSGFTQLVVTSGKLPVSFHVPHMATDGSQYKLRMQYISGPAGFIEFEDVRWSIVPLESF